MEEPLLCHSIVEYTVRYTVRCTAEAEAEAEATAAYLITRLLHLSLLLLPPPPPTSNPIFILRRRKQTAAQITRAHTKYGAQFEFPLNCASIFTFLFTFNAQCAICISHFPPPPPPFSSSQTNERINESTNERMKERINVHFTFSSCWAALSSADSSS